MGYLSGQGVTILGAGIAGLSLACALAQRGAEVMVIEQSPVIREFGAGFQITPNGATVLKALGLGRALTHSSIRARAVDLYHGERASLVMRMDLAKHAPDMGWYFVHRADLVSLLAQAADMLHVRFSLGKRVERIDLSHDQPYIHLNDGILSAHRVIGADGLHSRMRVALNGTRQLFFTGQVAWRAVISDPNALEIAEIHAGAGRHLVSYPLVDDMRNIVAVEERQNWAEENWHYQDQAQNLRNAFADFGPRVQGWLEQVRDPWLWGLFRHPVALRWGTILPHGFVALLGDAAHPTLPFLAQGANMALEDAWVLAALIDRHGFGAQTMRAYHEARVKRCQNIIAAANRNARAYHLRGGMRFMAHKALKLGHMISGGAAIRRYHWIHGYDVTREYP